MSLRKIIGDVFVTVLLLLTFVFGVFSALDNRLQDVFYQRMPPIHPNIVVIGIDEYTIAQLGTPDQWSRQIMADAINILNRDPNNKPAVIGIDILYTVERDDKQADQALAEAVKNAENIVLAANTLTGYVQNPANPSQTIRAIISLELPFPVLREHVRFGNANNVIFGADSVARRTDLHFVHEDEVLYSFAYEVYSRYIGDENVAFTPEEKENIYITYYGNPGMYKQRSFADIFSDNFEPEFFADSIVLIGAYAHGLLDAYHTPVHNELMHGVEIQANITQMLLEGNFKYYLGDGIDFVILLFIILLAVLLPHFLDLRAVLAAYAGLLLLYFISAWFLFDMGWLVTLVYPILAVTVICAYRLIYGYTVRAIEIAELKSELLESRISTMISQIQPHFIYNSLAAIKVLCRIDPEEARKTIDEFSDYLRHNIDSLSIKGMLPFEKELSHVETYLSLEKKRYGDKLNVEYDIMAREFLIPALTLQPVVENAVRHGLAKRLEGGTVKVRTQEKDGYIFITVTDDGVGFDTSVKPKPDAGARLHVGIENVRSRLAAMCKGELTITSEIGVGTIATITISI